MTYRQLIDRLLAAGIDNATGEARLMVEHFTNQQPDAPLFDPDASINDPQSRLADAVHRRENREPLQYILGTWYFWRQEYEVSPDCLVPRPDTEILVEQALKVLPRGGQFLDLCTGSGCIPISMLCERPDTTATAVELSAPTLALAKRNATRNGVSTERLTLLQGDVLAPEFLSSIGTFDLVVSNPPYIPTRELATLPPETRREPMLALDGGEDGLIFYRRMLQPDYRALCRNGANFLFEIGYDQGDALCALAAEHGLSCRIIKDYGGNDRVAWVTE